MCLISCVMCHASFVMCLVTHISCHLSPVTCHLSLPPTAIAIDPPRLGADSVKKECHEIFDKKSRIQETLNLLTDADSWFNTIVQKLHEFLLLQDFSFRGCVTFLNDFFRGCMISQKKKNALHKFVSGGGSKYFFGGVSKFIYKYIFLFF